MTSESRRYDLYTGLTEALGVERADTLMAHLPTHQFDDLATRTDTERLTERIDNVERNLTNRIDRLESDLTHRFDILNQRIDRIVLTLVAGLFAMVATMIAQGFF